MGETTDEVRFVDEFEAPVVEPSSGTRVTGTSEEANEGGQEAAEIRSGIEQTRADLSETIDALQEKLDPARIAEQVKGQIREKATEALRHGQRRSKGSDDREGREDYVKRERNSYERDRARRNGSERYKLIGCGLHP